ncbi:hypothetical protein B0H19DRAFT_1061570 [Mycena capillaripes]|nr:hypothetical protein B0H19DRAFT_1061570 [Mycena capillaripes]
MTATAPEDPAPINLQHFLKNTEKTGYKTLSQAVEVVAVLLQIARIIQPILADPSAKISDESSHDVQGKCRKLWKMMYTGTQKVEETFRAFRKDHAGEFKSGEFALVDSCINWWHNIKTTLESISYKQGRVRSLFKSLDEVTKSSDLLKLRGTLKKTQLFVDLIIPLSIPPASTNEADTTAHTSTVPNNVVPSPHYAVQMSFSRRSESSPTGHKALSLMFSTCGACIGFGRLIPIELEMPVAQTF